MDQVRTVDQRGESDPTWIGAVRGGYGNPVKVLHTTTPLSDNVTEAFRKALTARGMLAASGAGVLDLNVTIVDFQSSQYHRRDAEVDFVIELTDRASGRQIYHDEVKRKIVSGSIIALDIGVFGSSDDLQAVAQQAMNQAIDAAIDNPAFVAAASRDRR